MRALVLAGLFLLLSSLGFAAEAAGSLNVRGSVAWGRYDGSFAGFSDHADGWGAGLGAGLAVKDFFGDLAVDYYHIPDNDVHGKLVRTDTTATVGYRVGLRLAPFGGYRHGLQDDHAAFGSNIWTENGWIAGLGLGPFSMGDSVRLSLSGAYNWNHIDFDGGGDTTFNGLSGKLRLGLSGTPHSIELRYQRFTTTFFGFDVKETYTFLAYVFTWKAASF